MAYQMTKTSWGRWYQAVVVDEHMRRHVLRRRLKAATLAEVYAGRVMARYRRLKALAGATARDEGGAAAAAADGVGVQGAGVDYAQDDEAKDQQGG